MHPAASASSALGASGAVSCIFEYSGVPFFLPARFTDCAPLGKGSFGTVISALDTSTHTRVAIKKLSFLSTDALSMKRVLREINLLRTLKHPNLIAIREVIKGNAEEERERLRERSAGQSELPPSTGAAPAAPAVALAGDDGASSAGNTPPRPTTSQSRPSSLPSTLDVLYIVSEAMPGDLASLIANPNHSFSAAAIRTIMSGVLSAVTYLHSLDVLHRDLKPSNVLIDAENYEIKICDLGLARVDPAATAAGWGGDSTAEEQESPSALTEQVVSRWYRAPEVMLSRGDYGVALDVWSVGTILAELLGRKVLFPGRNVLDQVRLITDVVGRPSREDIDSFPALDSPCRSFLLSLLPSSSSSHSRALDKLYRDASNLHDLYPFAPRDSIDLLWRLLAFNPRKRLPAYLAMQHDFFTREPGRFEIRNLPDRMKTQARLERGNDALVTNWANINGQLTAAQTREKASAAKAQQERDELLLFLAASSSSSAAAPSSDTQPPSLSAKQSSAASEDRHKSLTRGVSLNSRRRTMEGRREATAAAASLAAAAAAAAALLPLELPAAPELPVHDTSTLSPSSAVAPIILEYHRLSCGCKVCSFCQTKRLLHQRMGVYESALARLETASAHNSSNGGTGNGGKNPPTAAAVSSVLDSPEGCVLLREVLRAQIDEFAGSPTSTGSTAGGDGYTSSPPLHPRVQSLLQQSAAVAPVSLSSAEKQPPDLNLPPSPKRSPSLPLRSIQRRSSASPSPSSSPVGRRSPVTLAAPPQAPSQPLSAGSKAAASAAVKSRPNVPNAFAATSKRGASIRAHISTDASVSPVAASDPHKKPAHFRSLSLPVWTDMVSAVSGSGGMATSSMPQEAVAAAAVGAPPLKRVPSRPVTVSEEPTDLQPAAAVSSVRTTTAATATASMQHQHTLSVRRTATLVSMPEAPIMTASSIAGSVDGLLAALKEKQQRTEHKETSSSPDKSAVSSSSPSLHPQTPQQLASITEIVVGHPAASFERGRSGSAGNGTAASTPPSGLPKVHATSLIQRSRSPLPLPQLQTSPHQQQASFSPVSSPTMPARGGRGVSSLMLPSASSSRPPLSPLPPGVSQSSSAGLPPHPPSHHPTPSPVSSTGSAVDIASPLSANNNSPKTYSQHFAAAGTGATPLSAGGFAHHGSNGGNALIMPVAPSVPLLAPSSGRSSLASSRRAGRMSLPTNSFAAHVAANLSPTAAPAQTHISNTPTPPRGAALPIDKLPAIERVQSFDRTLDRPETERTESGGNAVRASRRSRGSLILRASLAPTAADAQSAIAGAVIESVEIPVLVDGSARGVQRRATFTLGALVTPEVPLPVYTRTVSDSHDSPPKPVTAAAPAPVPSPQPTQSPVGGRHMRHTSWSSKSTAPSHTDGSLPAPRTHVSVSSSRSVDPVFGALVHPSAASDAPAVSTAAFAPFPRRNSHHTAAAVNAMTAAHSSPLHSAAAAAGRNPPDSSDLSLFGHCALPTAEATPSRAALPTHARRRSNPMTTPTRAANPTAAGASLLLMSPPGHLQPSAAAVAAAASVASMSAAIGSPSVPAARMTRAN